MEQPVEQTDRRGVLGEELAPVLEGPVGSYAEGPPFVGGSHQTEEHLGPGGVHRSEPDLIDEDQVRFEDLGDDLADRVVGEGSVESLDELGGSEVANPISGIDGLVAERNEEVALARPRWSDQTEVLLRPDPL